MASDDHGPVEGWLLRSSKSATAFLRAPLHVQQDISTREHEVWNGIKRYENAAYGWHGWLESILHIDSAPPAIAGKDLVPPVSWSEASKAVWPRLGRALKHDVVRFELAASAYFAAASKRGPRVDPLEAWLRAWRTQNAAAAGPPPTGARH